jgi:competence ComEA-like helix-hairpin-helix protein
MYPLSEFLGDVPEGWIAANARPDTMVELDLARVVQALPRERFAARPQTSAVSEEMTRMRDMFVPQAAGVEREHAAARPPAAVKPAVPASVRAADQVATPSVLPPPAGTAGPSATSRPEPAVDAKAPPSPGTAKLTPLPRPAPGPAWDGRDLRPDAGPNVVDLNRASVDDLARLPGVGAHLAETILAYRQEHGPFAGIFDLAEVEGIGPKTFTMITGLSLETRQDRHEVLNVMLGLAREARPSLAELAAAVAARLGVAGVVFSSLDGISLAHAGMAADQAGIYAAIVPQMFRRTRRYLRQLLDSRVQAMAIPLTRPPLLLVDASALFIVVALAESQDFDATSRQALELARELHWLLDYRAVVRPTA